MATKLVKTGTRGIYRRHSTDCESVVVGAPYVVVYRGKARTFLRLVEAREGKAAMEREAKLTRGHAAAGCTETSLGREAPTASELATRGQVSPFFHAYVLE
jgi:hypothetical protein